MSQLEKLNQCLACGSKSFDFYQVSKAQMHNEYEEYTFVKCSSCQLIMLNPRLKKAYLPHYYKDFYLPFRGPDAWGKFAPLVAKNLNKTDTKRIQLSQKVVKLDKASSVLDVGCGKPSFLKKIVEATNAYCKGIDFSDEGWRNDSKMYSKLDLEVSECHQFKTNKKFDLITMWHYLEHDYEPLKTLKRLKELVSINGRLIIEVPNHNSWTRKLQKSNWEGYHTPRHTAIYTPETIKILLNNSGWQVDYIKTYGTLDAYPLFWMGRQERKGIDWSGSMEKKFYGFVLGMILTAPIFWLKKWFSAGIMTIIAKPITQ